MRKLLVLTLLTAMVGCGSMMAKREMKGALAAVQSARSAGAEQDPQAGPRLSQAQTELQRAHVLLQNGDTKSAKNASENAYQYAEEALKIVRERGKSSGDQAASLTR